MPTTSPENRPTTRQDLFRRLDALGIAHRTIEHPPVFTVEESAVLDRAIPGGHTKNLFLKDHKDRLFLVVAWAHAKVDLKAMARAIGCGRLSFGRAELLLEVLGVTPGSVTAFAVINDPGTRVSVVIDATLMTYDTINCHPLTNTATTNIARDELLRFIRACGHAPRILYLAGDGAAEPPAQGDGP